MKKGGNTVKKTDEMILDSLRNEIEKSAETVQVPLRLQKESIVAMLKAEQSEEASSAERKSSRKKNGYAVRMAAVAAMIGIVFASALAMSRDFTSRSVRLNSMAVSNPNANSLRAVSGSEELENEIQSIIKRNSAVSSDVPSVPVTSGDNGNTPGYSGGTTTPAAPDSQKPAVDGYKNLVAVKDADKFSGGILGESAVLAEISEPIDRSSYEADIVKKSDNYLYVVSVVTDSETGVACEEIKIVKAAPSEEMKVVSTVGLSDNSNEDTVDNCLEIHIKNDMLIAIINRSSTQSGATSTLAVYYSISDPQNPQKIREHIQDGEYVSSSIQGNNLCLVTDKTLEECAEGESAVPSFSVDGEKYGLDAEGEIMIVNDPDTSYIFITVTDISDFSAKVGRLAIIGCGKNICCSAETVAVVREFTSAQADENGNREVKTEICRFNIEGTSIVCAGTQLVDGLIAGGVSVDKNGGNLRAITTSHGVSNIYVFDKEMKILSASTCPSEDASVIGTKYIGKNGYIVRIDENGKEQTVVISFENPEKPQAEGVIDTVGFSDSFCAVTDNLVLGIKTEEVYIEKEIYIDEYINSNEHSALKEEKVLLETVNVKSELVTFMLFDMSNPQKPVSADSWSFAIDGNIRFDLQDASGMVVIENEDIFGVPVRVYDEETKTESSAYQLFDVSEKTLDKTMILNHSDSVVGSTASRGVCIDGIFYAVSGDKITAFSIEDGKMISFC